MEKQKTLLITGFCGGFLAICSFDAQTRLAFFPRPGHANHCATPDFLTSLVVWEKYLSFEKKHPWLVTYDLTVLSSKLKKYPNIRTIWGICVKIAF